MESPDSENREKSLDENRTKTAAEVLKEKKIRLKNEIQELKELNFQIECCLNISKFGNIKHLLKYPEVPLQLPSKRIPDVETEYMDQLFKLAGMHCTKFVENEHVFSFSSPGDSVGNDAYAVQIINASEKPKIGKWVMPMSVDMNSILLETPLDTTMDLKLFLANCKHHIDCYTNRVQQYNELQHILDDLSGCWLDSRIGHTVITLKFLDMQDLDSNQSHNIILYLIYESNRVRPHKTKIDPFNSKTLAKPLVNKLKSYFKYFKCYDLRKAFKETVAAEDSQIVWKKREDADILSLNDSGASSSESNFLTKGKRGKETSRRRGLKRKSREAPSQNNESEDQDHESNDSDSQQVDDPQPTLLDSVIQQIEKSLENKGKRRASKKKPIPAAKTSKKESKSNKKQKETAEPRANVSKTTLRQSLLEFPSEKPRPAIAEQLNKDKSSAERIASAGTSAVRRKSKANVTSVENHEFGTSTPVSHLTRHKKRFAADNSSEVSPIISKSVLKKRQLPKLPE